MTSLAAQRRQRSPRETASCRARSRPRQPPFSSGAQISQVAASNAGVATCATRSSGPSCAKSVPRTRRTIARCGTATPLGTPGRPGGVDHVGEAVRVDVRRRSVRVLTRGRRYLLVDVGPARARQNVRNSSRSEACAVSSTPTPASCSRSAEALRGVDRVERHVRAAGLEDRQEHDDQVGRALQADAHRAPRGPRPGRAGGGPAVGPRVQLGVGQPAPHRRPPPSRSGVRAPAPRTVGAAAAG